MLNKVRKFLRDRSPDWLNTEVNKDLLQNLRANITSNRSDSPLTSYNGNFSPLPLMTDDCSLMTEKGTPHWRRINQVFQSLDTAPENATYSQLIEYVKETTGKGCSRKLISKWKKQRNSNQLGSTTDKQGNSELETAINMKRASRAIAYSEISQSQIINNTLSTQGNLQLTDSKPLMTDDWSLMTEKAWSYLAAAGIMVGLVGCEIIPLNNRPTENIAFASVTTPLAPLPPTPEIRKNRLEPNNIKIELTLSNPQDLKVKPGDKVSAGQTLSNRASERNRLQAKKKQLQLSIEKLNLPLTPIPQPRPIPEISPLPTVSYAEEEAEIKLKQQKLKEAENAIALAQKKIDSLTQLNSSSQVPPLIRGVRGDQEQGSTPNLKLILEHEQANLKNLETAKQSAQIQLEVAISQLTTAKENRAYIEYQRQLELSRRAIALEQQYQAIQRTESERQVLLAEREYSIAQIETQIQEIDYQIEQLSTVKAPYEGTIKKVKWTGQSDHNLTALVTLSVSSEQSTALTVNSQQSSVISENESVKTESVKTE